jgi:hypothetical protein
MKLEQALDKVVQKFCEEGIKFTFTKEGIFYKTSMDCIKGSAIISVVENSPENVIYLLLKKQGENIVSVVDVFSGEEAAKTQCEFLTGVSKPGEIYEVITYQIKN